MQAVRANDSGEDERPSGNAPEGKIRFFHEVFQVHAVETGDKGTGANTKGANGEFEVQQHEGVTIGVEDDVDTKVIQELAFSLH